MGILFLDFQFSTAHQFFCFRSVRNANQAVVVGAVEMWESRRVCEISKAAWKWWEARRSLSTRRHFHNARYIFCADLHHFPFGNSFAQ